MNVDFAKKTVFFFVCLFVFSVNVLASSNTFARFDRHEPNTPQAKWVPTVAPTPPPGATTTPNHVAYFRDDAVAAVHMITGATAGETWTVEVLQPKKADGTPGGPVLMPAFPTITYSGGCFRAPRMASVCGSPNWGIRWFIQSQCKPTGTWTFNLKNNGVVFKSAMVDLLPKVNDVNVLALQFAENQGAYPQSYDGICHPKKGRKAVNCQDPNATATPYSIAAKGCLISSVDMVMKYHGRNSAVAFGDTPNMLDPWLVASNGYTYNGSLRLAKPTTYPGANIHFDKKIDQRNDKLLRDKLCRYGPTPIAVKGGGHFVVATGIANEGTASQTIEVLDPADGVATTLAKKYGNNYTGIRSYRGPESVWTSSNGIEIRVYSPVELLITDPLGRRLGYDRSTGAKFTEIPEGTYSLEPEISLDPTFSDPDPAKDIFIYHAINGNYTLKAIGTGTGTYDLEFLLSDMKAGDLPGGNKVLHSIPVTPGAVHTYTFNYNSALGSVINVVGALPPQAEAMRRRWRMRGRIRRWSVQRDSPTQP